MFSDGYMKRKNHPLLRLLNPLRRLRLPQCRWIGNYYFMTHQSWIWVHKDFQQDGGEITSTGYEGHLHRHHILTVV